MSNGIPVVNFAVLRDDYVVPSLFTINSSIMKKKHFVNIWFQMDRKESYRFCGLVTGKEENGKVYISPAKIFKAAFGFELPAFTKMTIG
jgi:hypothetical protein